MRLGLLTAESSDDEYDDEGDCDAKTDEDEDDTSRLTSMTRCAIITSGLATMRTIASRAADAGEGDEDDGDGNCGEDRCYMKCDGSEG